MATLSFTGIAVETDDGKTFFFATEAQSEVEDYMLQLGYGSHRVWLRPGIMQMVVPEGAVRV
jgi:hypothetical protein